MEDLANTRCQRELGAGGNESAWKGRSEKETIRRVVPPFVTNAVSKHDATDMVDQTTGTHGTKVRNWTQSYPYKGFFWEAGGAIT